MNMNRNEQESWLYRYRPHYPSFEMIPHYYGDVVRMLFLASAVIVLGGAPLYADMLLQQLPYLIVGAVIAVALAAITSPWSTLVMRINAVAAGVGAIVFEYWALWFYESGTPLQFAVRQAIALISMFAFYFALKTLRSMLTGTMGKEGDLSEFASDAQHVAKEEMASFDESIPEDALGHVAALEDDSGND